MCYPQGTSRKRPFGGSVFPGSGKLVYVGWWQERLQRQEAAGIVGRGVRGMGRQDG